ncbi:MAG: succinate dehydrogenase, hydrophobic membrane anchor protein [Pseudomonadota bacterium]
MSGRNGTTTFIMQRASAVLLLPLVAWFVWSVAAHAGDDLAGARLWAGKPMNTILLGAFVTVGAFHMRIGMMEVIEDYIHGGLNSILNALNWLVAIAVAGATWWALLSLPA